MEQEAIRKGQNWMQKSQNPSHDYEHAKNVSRHAIEIYRSLEEPDEKVDEDLILITCWWHDSYKALFLKKKVYIELFEGIGSARIAKKELQNLLSSERLSMVLKAISVHNNFVLLLLMGNRMPLLTRVLVEADAIDAQSRKRKDRSNMQPKSFFHFLLGLCLEPVLNFFQKIYIKTDYAKMEIERLKKQKGDENES